MIPQCAMANFTKITFSHLKLIFTYTPFISYHKIVAHKLHNFKFHISITISFKYHGGGYGVFKGGGKAGVAPPKIRIISIGRACAMKDFELYSTVEANNKNRCRGTGGKFVVADQKIAGRNKAHCIYIQNKAES